MPPPLSALRCRRAADEHQAVTSYANAPEAQLYGAEFELTKYLDLSDAGGWLTARRAVIIANYTYSHSKLKVGANDPVAVYASASTKASQASSTPGARAFACAR